MRLGFLAKGPWRSRLSWDTSLPDTALKEYNKGRQLAAKGNFNKTRHFICTVQAGCHCQCVEYRLIIGDLSETALTVC